VAIGDGKLYQTADGATFFIQCCTHGAATVIKSFIAKDFRECMNECSKTDDCNRYVYCLIVCALTPVLTKTKACSMLLTIEPPSRIASASSARMVVSPPPSVVLRTCTVMRSSSILPPLRVLTLPRSRALPSVPSHTASSSLRLPERYVAHDSSANHTPANSSKAFRLDCGKRHGTQVIYRDRQNSFKDCVQACGKLSACHSADYDAKRKICYYSNHHGEPTVNAPGFASAYSMGCAGACSGGCGGCSGCHKVSERACTPFTCRCEQFLTVNPIQGSGDDEPAQPPDNSPFAQDGYLSSPSAPEAICPGSNGKIITAGNGRRYRVTCDKATTCTVPQNDIRITYPVMSMQTCADDCSKHPECKSVNFFTDGGEFGLRISIDRKATDAAYSQGWIVWPLQHSPLRCAGYRRSGDNFVDPCLVMIERCWLQGHSILSRNTNKDLLKMQHNAMYPSTLPSNNTHIQGMSKVQLSYHIRRGDLNLC
jgi:hypothetical protein